MAPNLFVIFILKTRHLTLPKKKEINLCTLLFPNANHLMADVWKERNNRWWIAMETDLWFQADSMETQVQKLGVEIWEISVFEKSPSAKTTKDFHQALKENGFLDDMKPNLVHKCSLQLWLESDPRMNGNL